jgi:hypothetical protein
MIAPMTMKHYWTNQAVAAVQPLVLPPVALGPTAAPRAAAHSPCRTAMRSISVGSGLVETNLPSTTDASNKGEFEK